jgi:peptidoglycan glycosyltransferase
MCMVSAMYANGGEMMAPYLVGSVEDADGHVLQETSPRTWRSPISESTAATVQDLMINAVENGAVSGAAIDGYVVGGKTGTAETGDGGTHQWFIGFIGDDQPRYAVSVVLEDAETGLGSAVAIGREMLLATIQATSPDD